MKTRKGLSATREGLPTRSRRLVLNKGGFCGQESLRDKDCLSIATAIRGEPLAPKKGSANRPVKEKGSIK